MVYTLDERHLLINKQKRSFRAQKPKLAHVSIDDNLTVKECEDVTFSFQVRNEYIKYILEDQADACFPLTVEGKWHLDFSEEELLEE